MIEVKKIFPPPAQEWILYDKPPDEKLASLPTYLPISLYIPLDNLYYFGYMNVTTYIRKT